MNTTSRRKILVIDDEGEHFQALKPQLEASGFFVYICKKVDQLAQACKSAVYDLVLIDIDRPDLVWQDLVEMLVEGIGIHSPIIFMTQNMGIESLTQALRAGVSDFIQKPIEIDAVVDIFNHHIINNMKRVLGYELTHTLRVLHNKYIFYPEDYLGNNVVKYIFFDIQKCLNIHPLKKNEIYLVIDEAISNAFLHGIWQLTDEECQLDEIPLQALIKQKNKEAKTKGWVNVEVLLDKKTNKLEIAIKDSGNGFDYASYLENMNSNNHHAVTGRGLFLIHSLAERVGFEEGGTRIVIVVNIANA